MMVHIDQLRVSLIERSQRVLNGIGCRIPPYAQELLSCTYLRYFQPIFLGPIKYLKFYNFLRKSQWWTFQELVRYQEIQLRQLLKYAYMNIPYYADMFVRLNLKPEDIISIDDLRKLPILTKEDVVKNIDKLVSHGAAKLMSTSGTTGKSMQFYLDRRYIFARLAFIKRSYDMMSIRNQDKNIFLWSIPFIKDKVDNYFLYEPLLKRLSLSTVPKHTKGLDKYLILIKQFNPCYVIGSPSLMYHLACYAKENAINGIKFNTFVSWSENIFPYQREIIESEFQCEVFNWYMTEERVISAIECQKHKGMHIDMERGIWEIIDKDGKRVTDGEQGRVITTGFYNNTMPFIRYEIGDVAAISRKPCSCGRGLPLLESFDGRHNETLQWNGKVVYSTPLSVIISQFKNIKECQFIQEHSDEIMLNIVKREKYTEHDTQELIYTLRKKIDDNLKIKISFIEHIPRTNTGKFPLIISKLNSMKDKQ